MAEAEINKPAFGQEEGFEDMVHSLSPLLSIICLGTLIFGMLPKASLCAHINLDNGPAERCWSRNRDMQGTFPPLVSSQCDLELLSSHRDNQDCAPTNRVYGNSSAS